MKFSLRTGSPEKTYRLNEWILRELRRGIVLYFSLSLFVILAVTSYLTLRTKANGLLEANFSFASTQIRNLQLYDYTRVDEELSRFAQSRSISYAEVKDKFGVVIGRTKASFEGPAANALRFQLFERPGSQVSWVEGSALGNIEINTVIAEASNETLGNLALVIPLIVLLKEAFITTGVFALVLLCLYLYSGIVVRRAARFVSEPIAEMSALLLRTEHWDSLPRTMLTSHVAELDHLYGAFRDLITRLKQVEEERVKSERMSAIGRLAAQISHDIRSPVAALDTVINAIKTNNTITEEQRLLIRSASTRIRDIANNLLEKNNEQKAPSTPVRVETQTDEPFANELVAGTVHMLVSEKRMQYLALADVVIEEDTIHAYGLFSRIQSNSFKRVLSNLINNSVEAVHSKGKVIVRIEGRAGKILVSVSDNGQGISPEIIPKLMQRGETHGKPGGQGLGLYHAKQCLESWGGSIEINSRLGKGTEILMTLPVCEPPAWFASIIGLRRNLQVIIADDDPSIHAVWRDRFSTLDFERLGITLTHFHAPSEVIEWVQKQGPLEAVFLVDYEFLGHELNGIDIIQQLGISKRSYLVTGRFEEGMIRDSCTQLGVKLIPKELAVLVPIEVSRNPGKLSVVSNTSEARI